MSDEFSSKNKYTAIVAFSTPSGPLHVGHALGYVAASSAALVESLQSGREIFFPFGVHSTGKDLLRIVDSLRQGINPSRYGLHHNQVQDILSATDPIDTLLHEFTDSYADDLDSLGITLDKDSYFSTHHKIYEPFLHWTLQRLDDKGLIVSTDSLRPYCNLCDEVKSIQADQSEALAIGSVNWDEVRVEDYKLLGGDSVCKEHPEEKIVVKKKQNLQLIMEIKILNKKQKI
ncbi:MAG: hypothetical protein ACQESE_02315 [Nanobdellota archaeon]